jgi:hypothetical protein
MLKPHFSLREVGFVVLWRALKQFPSTKEEKGHWRVSSGVIKEIS